MTQELINKRNRLIFSYERLKKIESINPKNARVKLKLQECKNEIAQLEAWLNEYEEKTP